LFTETRANNFIELKRILDSNLSEFISVNNHSGVHQLADG